MITHENENNTRKTSYMEKIIQKLPMQKEIMFLSAIECGLRNGDG